MSHAHEAKLRSFIETEINLAFTFIQIARSASSKDRKERADQHARKALDMTNSFIQRLCPGEIPLEWRSRVTELRAILESPGEDLES